MAKPDDIPQDIWEAATEIVRQSFADPLAPMAPYLARAILAERKRAIAAIHWVFSADGTKLERSMADEAINKINDPDFGKGLKDHSKFPLPVEGKTA